MTSHRRRSHPTNAREVGARCTDLFFGSRGRLWWLVCLCVLAPCGNSPSIGHSRSQLRALPTPLYGVTIDDADDLDSITASLQALSRLPTTRIVFDPQAAASYYRPVIDAFYPVSYLMGEIVDSIAVRNFTVSDYLARTQEYVDTFAHDVDIWEIGNEVNGEWLGPTSDVAAKVTGAYDLIKARGLRAAVTLFYNEGCLSDPQNEMFVWAKNHLPARMKSGLDYVLVSYYEDDCKRVEPEWPSVFQRLATLFPRSKIGFGEVGTRTSEQKAAFVDHYYRLKVDVPNYIGGYFWWYFREDMVPSTLPLWSVLDRAWKQEAPLFGWELANTVSQTPVQPPAARALPKP
jgi:hypothetical protein